MIAGWVVDTSVTLAWALPDEQSPAADRFWAEVESGTQLLVPALWWYECANALIVARRREHIDAEQASRLSSLLSALPLTTHPAPGGSQLARLEDLALRHHLSGYDAAYLELAERLQAGIATLDQRLTAAARSAGLTVWLG
jgi:predicted nucleic acid-binding protein